MIKYVRRNIKKYLDLLPFRFIYKYILFYFNNRLLYRWSRYKKRAFMYHVFSIFHRTNILSNVIMSLWEKKLVSVIVLDDCYKHNSLSRLIAKASQNLWCGLCLVSSLITIMATYKEYSLLPLSHFFFLLNVSTLFSKKWYN